MARWQDRACGGRCRPRARDCATRFARGQYLPPNSRDDWMRSLVLRPGRSSHHQAAKVQHMTSGYPFVRAYRGRGKDTGRAAESARIPASGDRFPQGGNRSAWACRLVGLQEQSVGRDHYSSLFLGKAAGGLLPLLEGVYKPGSSASCAWPIARRRRWSNLAQLRMTLPECTDSTASNGTAKSPEFSTSMII